MSMLSNLDLVRRVPLFSTLSDEQAAQVAEAVVKRRFKRGQTIVEQGQRTDTLFILLNGRARVQPLHAFLQPRAENGAAGHRGEKAQVQNQFMPFQRQTGRALAQPVQIRNGLK